MTSPEIDQQRSLIIQFRRLEEIWNIQKVIIAKFPTTKQAFQHMDYDQDGFIYAHEFAKVLLMNNIFAPRDGTRKLFDFIDQDKNGRINEIDWEYSFEKISLELWEIKKQMEKLGHVEDPLASSIGSQGSVRKNLNRYLVNENLKSQEFTGSDRMKLGGEDLINVLGKSGDKALRDSYNVVDTLNRGKRDLNTLLSSQEFSTLLGFQDSLKSHEGSERKMPITKIFQKSINIETETQKPVRINRLYDYIHQLESQRQNEDADDEMPSEDREPVNHVRSLSQNPALLLPLRNLLSPLQPTKSFTPPHLAPRRHTFSPDDKPVVYSELFGPLPSENIAILGNKKAITPIFVDDGEVIPKDPMNYFAKFATPDGKSASPQQLQVSPKQFDKSYSPNPLVRNLLTAEKEAKNLISGGSSKQVSPDHMQQSAANYSTVEVERKIFQSALDNSKLSLNQKSRDFTAEDQSLLKTYDNYNYRTQSPNTVVQSNTDRVRVAATISPSNTTRSDEMEIPRVSPTQPTQRSPSDTKFGSPSSLSKNLSPSTDPRNAAMLYESGSPKLTKEKFDSSLKREINHVNVSPKDEISRFKEIDAEFQALVSQSPTKNQGQNENGLIQGDEQGRERHDQENNVEFEEFELYYEEDDEEGQARYEERRKEMFKETMPRIVEDENELSEVSPRDQMSAIKKVFDELSSKKTSPKGRQSIDSKLSPGGRSPNPIEGTSPKPQPGGPEEEINYKIRSFSEPPINKIVSRIYNHKFSNSSDDLTHEDGYSSFNAEGGHEKDSETASPPQKPLPKTFKTQTKPEETSPATQLQSGLGLVPALKTAEVKRFDAGYEGEFELSPERPGLRKDMETQTTPALIKPVEMKNENEKKKEIEKLERADPGIVVERNEKSPYSGKPPLRSFLSSKSLPEKNARVSPGETPVGKLRGQMPVEVNLLDEEPGIPSADDVKITRREDEAERERDPMNSARIVPEQKNEDYENLLGARSDSNQGQKRTETAIFDSEENAKKEGTKAKNDNFEFYENYDDGEEEGGEDHFEYHDEEDDKDISPLDNMQKNMIGNFNFERNLLNRMGDSKHHDIISFKNTEEEDHHVPQFETRPQQPTNFKNEPAFLEDDDTNEFNRSTPFETNSQLMQYAISNGYNVNEWKKKGLEIQIPPTDESLFERKSQLLRESNLARLMNRGEKNSDSISQRKAKEIASMLRELNDKKNEIQNSNTGPSFDEILMKLNARIRSPTKPEISMVGRKSIEGRTSPDQESFLKAQKSDRGRTKLVSPMKFVNDEPRMNKENRQHNQEVTRKNQIPIRSYLDDSQANNTRVHMETSREYSAKNMTELLAALNSTPEKADLNPYHRNVQVDSAEERWKNREEQDSIQLSEITDKGIKSQEYKTFGRRDVREKPSSLSNFKFVLDNTLKRQANVGRSMNIEEDYKSNAHNHTASADGDLWTIRSGKKEAANKSTVSKNSNSFYEDDQTEPPQNHRLKNRFQEIMKSLGAFTIQSEREYFPPEPKPQIRQKTPDYNTPKFNKLPKEFSGTGKTYLIEELARLDFVNRQLDKVNSSLRRFAD